MEIIVGKTAGFCFGVLNAVNKTDKLLETEQNMFCLGELVHNKQVNEDLIKKGLTFINDIEEKQNVIIRAHGEPIETYKKAEKLEVNLFDLTCPKVLNIHNIASEYSNNGYYILLVGHKEHPETIGTISYCGENADIIQNNDDVLQKLNKFYNSSKTKLLVLVQTTYSLEKFNEIVSLIKEDIKKSNKKIEVKIKNTICDATKLRQDETKEIAKKVDMMIIVGGKNSSNTNKLYEIAKKHCIQSILIESKNELDLNSIKKIDKIGIMAGASTPQKSIEEVVEKLRQV